ncbi:zinc ribbon domain-containing protein [Methylobacterium sp. J-043]|nr:zinc ribbon domain-containing protein [Methylobacterium sp. J-043]
MPIYDYACDACGPFTAMRPMAQFRDPCACPECGDAVARTFLSAPAIVGGNAGGRLAFAATEPSATHSGGAPAVHPAGCGCCMRRSPIPSALASTGRVFTSSGPLPRSGR